MADILIRGMEIPKNCSSCKIICWNYLEYGINGILRKLSTSESRDPNCPLFPIQEGHGDLIDRDALKKRTPMVIDYSAGGFGTDGSIRPVRGYGDWQIDQAPTIVPAEGGDN